MRTKDFEYCLPPELIAQEPLERRSESRMLVLGRGEGIAHRKVRDLGCFLREGDLLVLNNTRVFSARAFGVWSDTGGRCEILLIEPGAEGLWYALCRSSRRVSPGLVMSLAEGRLKAVVREKLENGRLLLRLEHEGDLFELLRRYGVPPVPPYIRRGEDDRRVETDKSRYQTVFASETGAVAAPTAGLHFTQDLLRELEEAGVGHVFLTLHVGPGTFKPVKSSVVEGHVMEEERFSLSGEAVGAIERVRAAGGRIVAVGSTTVRTLETVAAENGGRLAPCSGRSGLFIYPPYEFAVVDAMLTNFHLPCSTLLMMVSALAGREAVLAAYEEAIRLRYRFYSYGDCMLIL